MDFNWVSTLLSTNTNVLSAALISALISAFVAYISKIREYKGKLVADHDHEQRKALRSIIGRTHGRLLHAGNSLNHRFWNLYANHDKRWLEVTDLWNPDNYYLHSFACRFMAVFALIREFERQAVYVDSRIALKSDLVFLKYVAALHWCMTDVALFEGIEYDSSDQVDHFYSDALREYSDTCIDDNGNMLKPDTIVARAKEGGGLQKVFEFFHGLSHTEDRLRWDRLVALHLLIVTFVNTIGYPEHRTSDAKIRKIADQVRNKKVLTNLAAWLPRHGLDKDANSKKLLRICLQASEVS
jgi:hypothetical protein